MYLFGERPRRIFALFVQELLISVQWCSKMLHPASFNPVSRLSRNVGDVSLRSSDFKHLSQSPAAGFQIGIILDHPWYVPYVIDLELFR
jgi:hypothetical protein